jgi:hypothetical protein
MSWISSTILLLILHAYAMNHAPEEIRGRISTIISDNFEKGVSTVTHILHSTSVGQSREIHFDEFPHLRSAVNSGHHEVLVRGRNTSKGFSVHHFEVLANSNTNNNEEISLSSSTLITTKKILLIRMDMSACGTNGAPSKTEQQILNAFSESANPSYQTFGQHLRSCSRGQFITQFNITTVIMPCNSSGTFSGFTGSYVWNGCGTDGASVGANFTHVALKAVDILQQQNFDFVNYNTLIVNTPASM